MVLDFVEERRRAVNGRVREEKSLPFPPWSHYSLPVGGDLGIAGRV